MTWLKKQNFRVHHSPNGGRRSLNEGYLFKMMGVSKGFPDVFVCLRTPVYTSFYIEMKPIKGGKVEPEQAQWLQCLREQGAYAEVANGFEEAKKMFTFYLSTLPTTA